MNASVSTYSEIIFGSMLKFIIGPIIGGAENLPFYVTGFLTALGMMISVVIVTFLGQRIRLYLKKSRLKKNKKFKFRKKHRTMIRIWNEYGILGVSFLTPLILTPVGGALIAVSLGAKKKKILLYMSISSVFWGNILSYILLNLEQEILHWL